MSFCWNILTLHKSFRFNSQKDFSCLLMPCKIVIPLQVNLFSNMSTIFFVLFITYTPFSHIPWFIYFLKHIKFQCRLFLIILYISTISHNNLPAIVEISEGNNGKDKWTDKESEINICSSTRSSQSMYGLIYIISLFRN